MLLEIFLCAAITVLLILLGWGISALFLLPVRGDEVYMLLSASGDGAGLEHQCRAYLLLKGLGLLHRPLLMVDFGLNEQGRALAEKLTVLDGAIVLCSPEEMTNLLHNGA